MIPVTKPFLPPQNEYNTKLNGIWKRNWLTNHGPVVNEFELLVKDFLQLPHLLYVSSGTFALQLAIKALDLKGDIITTPFSYVATTSSIVWENCTPIFVDIDPDTFTIDAKKIEEAITEKTSAIIATHVFGNACDIDSISKIARKHNLKVIYDAAHCFGVNYKGESIFSFGDVSIGSLHATKLFHTVEGGLISTSKPDVLKKASLLRNFGHLTPYTFDGPGVNGKSSEFHAAMGVCNFKYVDEILSKRKELSDYYDEKLSSLHYLKQKINSDTDFNYAYYPILFESEDHLIKQMEELAAYNIQTRRYFYPSLSTLNYVGDQASNTPVANDIASRILCLPLYHELDKEEIDLITRIMLRTQNYKY